MNSDVSLPVVCCGATWFPKTGFTWLSTFDAGVRAEHEDQSIEIPAKAGFHNGDWYRIRQEIKGLIVEADEVCAAPTQPLRDESARSTDRFDDGLREATRFALTLCGLHRVRFSAIWDAGRDTDLFYDYSRRALLSPWLR
ncbi:MAG: hypothetical protein K8U03_00400 [Planctomycetia bacterium]|nr:hypothetical protein [Planctomycetia bacterium]